MHFNEKILSCQFCPKRFAKCLAIPNNPKVNVKYLSRLNLLLLYLISIVCCCRDFIKQISKMLVNIHAMEYAVNLPMWAVSQTEVRINLQIKQTQQTQQAHRVKSPCLESPLSLQGYIHSQVLVDLFKHLQNTLLSGLASAYGEPELLLSAWKIWSKNYKVITQGHCYKWLIGCVWYVLLLDVLAMFSS